MALTRSRKPHSTTKSVPGELLYQPSLARIRNQVRKGFSFMGLTFLKKLGQVLATVAGEVTGIEPLIMPFLGSGKASQVAQTVVTDVNDLTAMGQQVVTIETALQGKPGSDKLTAVIPLITNIVKTSELVAGKKILDEALFIKGCTWMSQGSVDVLNSLDPAAVHTA
jgi:hypothetical protein